MKSSQRQFLCSVDGIPGYFATFEGAEVEAETSTAWDGGAKQPDLLSSPAETSNIVMQRPYDAAAHQPIIDRLEKVVGRLRVTVTKQPTDPDFTPIGRPKTYPASLLKRVTSPESDASSGDAATWELEFVTSGPA
jgi:hypothetical protein